MLKWLDDMKYIFFLSGENVELAKWEVRRLISSYGEFEEAEFAERILVAECGCRNVFYRLALTHEVSEYIASCSFKELKSVFSEIEPSHGTCCVRVRGIGCKVETLKLERELGAILWRKGAKISVSNPEKVFRVYITPRKCFVGSLVFSQNKKQFLDRSPVKRPFFMPFVVLPKFARSLVNLTGVKDGEKLLDPMCGTGSFLIEAGLMKIDVVGMDFFSKIVRGCMENLRFYGVSGEIVRGDVRAIPFKDSSFKAIVTDYPYLRSTKATGSLEEIYERSLEEFRRVIKDDGSLVIVTNLDIENYLEEFNILAKFTQRVHNSLTRRIYLLTL